MLLVKLTNVAYQYVTEPVLTGIEWEIHTGQKIGLVGPNGAGKSTLLRLIAGELAPDAGSVQRARGLRIGYLAQQPILDPARTIWEETLAAAGELQALEAELHHLERSLGDPEVYGHEARLARALEALERAQTAFEQMGGYRLESRAREVLQGLGFAEAEFDLSTGTLSGGQRKLVGLARLLLAAADLLLLDEPDNHLDLDAKARLEVLIARHTGAVVMVSHDRYLLDQTVDGIAELEDHRLATYAGNYSAYALEKQIRQLRQQQLYQAQAKEIARIEAAIARFEHWASIVVNERHARQARSRRKMLERMERVERPVTDRPRMGLELAGWRGSTKVLEITDLRLAFASATGECRPILGGVNLLLRHGERVGLVGPNGAGKSVLLRCILGALAPTAGEVRIGPSVRVGYYAQEHETLELDRMLIDEIRQVLPLSEPQAVSFLGRFLFPYERTRDAVRMLSGGERSRLQLAKLMLADVNLLLLDEPTNNLDLPSCEVLENALDEFEGTVLAVSHDRYFLNQVVERIVELDGGTLAEYVGDYSSYAEAKAQQGAQPSAADDQPGRLRPESRKGMR